MFTITIQRQRLITKANILSKIQGSSPNIRNLRHCTMVFNSMLCFLFKPALQTELCRLRFSQTFSICLCDYPNYTNGFSGTTGRQQWKIASHWHKNQFLYTPSLGVGRIYVGFLLKKTEHGKEGRKPAHKHSDACNVTKVSHPVLICSVNNGTHVKAAQGIFPGLNEHCNCKPFKSREMYSTKLENKILWAC